MIYGIDTQIMGRLLNNNLSNLKNEDKEYAADLTSKF